MTEHVILRCDRGFGAVKDPETGETLTVEEPQELPRAQAERVRDAYSGMHIEEPESEPDPERSLNITDEHWRTAKAAIESGEYDDQLDAVAEADDRDVIQEAVEARRGRL